MYVTNLCIDRFGVWQDRCLESLTDGLNVIYGPPGSGKASTVDFLRAIFGGFDSQMRDRRLVHASRGCGGSVTVWTASGKQTISRYDDGSRDGRLTVEHADGAVIGFRHLHELLRDLPLPLLDHAFIVDFSCRPELNELLSHASRCGLAVTDGDRDRSQEERDRRELADGERRIRELQHEVTEVERALIEWNARDLETSVPLTKDRRALPFRREAEVRAIDARLARWKRTLRDIVDRKRRVMEVVERSRDLAARSTPPEGPRRVLRSLERHIMQLQEWFERVAASEASSCPIPTLQESLEKPLHQMREDVYRACHSLSHWQTKARLHRAAEQSEQLSRCEDELRQSIRALRRRRRVLVHSIRQTDSRLASDADRLCECTSHLAQVPNDSTFRSGFSATGSATGAVREEIHRLTNRRIKCLAELDECRRGVEICRSRLSRQDVMPGTLVDAASHYLRRLTANQWRDIRVSRYVGDGGWLDISVDDAAGRSISYSALDEGVRDQAYLAVCMAVAAASERRGWHVPLIINAAFTNYPSQSIRDTLETMQDFGRGRQVLCFTRHEHVADVAYQLNVPVRSLTAQEIHRRTSTLVAPLPAETASVHHASGYLLHESDPIERTPSISELHAVRLRQAGIGTVGELLRRAAAEVASELQSLGVTTQTVELWQSQARLVCQLRGLRPYDARILVACGIHDPEQLVRLQPGALRARVRQLAASELGQTMILSGTEYELSRITDWIGAAQEAISGSVSNPRGSTSGSTSELGSTDASPRRRAARGGKRSQPTATTPDAAASTMGDLHLSPVESLVAAATGPLFHLRRSDAIVHAPIGGPPMLRRLEGIGIRSVEDLLNASAHSVAQQLQMRRVSPETVRQWQQQCELVCRVPRLRGRDAACLVAAGVVTVEQLAAAVPAAVYRDIQALIHSSERKRLLRGGKEPTLADVTDWVNSACQARPLLAA